MTDPTTPPPAHLEPWRAVMVVRPTQVLTAIEWSHVNAIRVNIAAMRDLDPTVARDWHTALNNTLALNNPGLQIRRMRAGTDRTLSDRRNLDKETEAP